MKHDVFISYPGQDKAIADAICDDLEQNGVRCWIAPRDILPGLSWGEAIIEGITGSRAMVFIFSSHSNKSPHALRELERAINQGIYIVPFRIENVPPSKSIEYFIGAAHWLDAYPQPSGKHYRILTETVKQLLAREAIGVEKLTEPEPLRTKDTQIPVSRSGAKMNEYEKGILFVENSLTKKQWVSCLRECEALFEKALRQLLTNLLESLKDANVRDTIIAAQKGIGQGDSTFECFGLAQLVTLYRDAGVFEELRKQLTSSLRKTRRIDWDQVIEWHEALGHPRDLAGFGKDDAIQMVYWLKLFVYDCELAGTAVTVSPVSEEARSMEECPCCQKDLEGDWNFCPQCGETLNVTCKACHRLLASGFRICPYCETRVLRRGAAEKDEARKAQEEYRVFCIGAYLDGVINVREKSLLENKRLELGLSAEESERIERGCAPENVVEYTRLVEGVLVDGVINEDERVFLQKKAEEMNIDPWLKKQIEEVQIETRKG